MKRLLLVLILMFGFQSWTKADDIRDFELEGMSVGDSLLDYVTEETILKEIKAATIYPSSDKFKILYIELDNYTTYQHLNVTIKKNDLKYKIYLLNGYIEKNLADCLKMKKTVIKEISNILPQANLYSYENDYNKKYKDSFAYVDDFNIENGTVRVWCDVWDKNLNTDWPDSFNVSAGNTEFSDFLENEAYK